MTIWKKYLLNLIQRGAAIGIKELPKEALIEIDAIAETNKFYDY